MPKKQLYHSKALVNAGMGFFTDAYDHFCITAVIKLLGRLYIYDPNHKPWKSHKPGALPDHVNNTITSVALCGTLAGQVFFGRLGMKIGRKKVYGITLITIYIQVCPGNYHGQVCPGDGGFVPPHAI